MSRNNVSGIAILLFALGAATCGVLEPARAEPEKITKISVDDLVSGRAIVIGRLGIPLKTMMTVRGTWRYPAPAKHPTKTYELSFHVTHVNGMELDQPVKFYRPLVHVNYPLPWDESNKKSKEPTPSDGDAWEMRAYETGSFRWRPDDFATELGAPPDSSSAWAEWESSFLVELHGIVQRPRAAKKPDQRKDASAQEKKP